MSDAEKRIIKMTADLWNALVELECLHPDDIMEMKTSIHQIQECVMSRPVKREMEYNQWRVS